MKDYQHLISLFSQRLEQYTASVAAREPSELYQPEAYILSLGGKRIRPLLALAACDLYEKDASLAVDAALAVELFHNFSLVHDDILDAAPLRRSQPTVHTKWNTNIAILSGDVMLVKALQVLEHYEAPKFRSLSRLFSRTAIEVCEGQQMDMNFEKLSFVPVEEYLRMITKKTAVLLGCSLQMGGICADADERDQKLLYEFGKHLGIAFQLLDDLLDAFANDQEKFGKQVGGDIIANKKTFLTLKSLELASETQRNEISGIMDLSDKREKVQRMLSLYNRLNVSAHCKKAADDHTSKAIAALDQIKGNPVKITSLKNFAGELLNRQI